MEIILKPIAHRYQTQNGDIWNVERVELPPLNGKKMVRVFFCAELIYPVVPLAPSFREDNLKTVKSRIVDYYKKKKNGKVAAEQLA